MLHETLPPPSEPRFELPPRLSARPERRLTSRAVADYGLAREFRDNALRLVFAGERVEVVVVGGAVAANFGIAIGPLVRGDDDLGARLSDACAALRAAGAVVGFEAALRTPLSACVLMRGVLLPTRDGAEAVLSWKEVLGRDATARLRAELLDALHPPPVVRADAFARPPAGGEAFAKRGAPTGGANRPWVSCPGASRAA